jgi:integrase
MSACRAAEPREKRYKLSDGHGLRLVVHPSGAKQWQLFYRHGGKDRTLTIGPFDTYDVAAARRKAHEARRQIHLGIDPQADPEGADGVTFAQATQEHLAIWSAGKDAAHILRVQNRLKQDALPVLGSMTLASVKPADVVAVVRKVEERGALDVAKRLRQKISEVFQFAIAMGWCETDPAAHIGRVMRPRAPVEHMARVPLTEMPRLLADIASHRDDLARIALQFTLLTACRSTEAREGRWMEIHGDAWVIPATRMKMGREHVVPLSRQALELAEQLRAYRRNDYLFPGKRRAVVNTNFLIYALYDVGLHWRGKQTVHGFRSLFSTWANETGWRSDVVERCLAHVEGNKVRGAYNGAEWWGERVALMQAWGDTIDDWRIAGMLE